MLKHSRARALFPLVARMKGLKSLFAQRTHAHGVAVLHCDLYHCTAMCAHARTAAAVGRRAIPAGSLGPVVCKGAPHNDKAVRASFGS